jgi:hypothetical protein
MGIAIDKIRRWTMSRIYQVEDLTEAETIKLIYNDKDAELEIGDYRKLNNPKEIREKIRLLKIINTENSNKLATILEFAKVGGWNSVFQNDASMLTKLKDKLKLYYDLNECNFFVCLNEVNIYIPYIEVNVDSILKIYLKEKDKISYEQLRTESINILEQKLKDNDNYKINKSIPSILSDLVRPFDKYLEINFEMLYRILNFENCVLKDENNKGIPNKEIIPLNIEKFIKTLNKIAKDSNIIIITEHWNNKMLKSIAPHYEKFNNQALQFFFKNLVDKTLEEAMILTYANFKNIGFISGMPGLGKDYAKYTKENITKIENAYKIYRKNTIEYLLNSFKTNKFEDVEFDDKGNVINISPNQNRFLLKRLIHRLGNSISVNV